MIRDIKEGRYVDPEALNFSAFQSLMATSKRDIVYEERNDIKKTFENLKNTGFSEYNLIEDSLLKIKAKHFNTYEAALNYHNDRCFMPFST
jgi:hypothetical protein